MDKDAEGERKKSEDNKKKKSLQRRDNKKLEGENEDDETVTNELSIHYTEMSILPHVKICVSLEVLMTADVKTLKMKFYTPRSVPSV